MVIAELHNDVIMGGKLAVYVFVMLLFLITFLQYVIFGNIVKII